jgi:hypothetical protein
MSNSGVCAPNRNVSQKGAGLTFNDVDAEAEAEAEADVPSGPV